MYKYIVLFCAFLADITPVHFLDNSIFSIVWLLFVFIITDITKSKISPMIYVSLFFIEDIVNLHPFGISSLAFLMAFYGRHLIFTRDTGVKIMAQPRFEKYAQKAKIASHIVFIKYITFTLMFFIFQSILLATIGDVHQKPLHIMANILANIVITLLAVELKIKKI